MTTPNEELRKQLQQIYKSGELYYRGISDTTDLLQSQAERIKELELDLDVQAGSIEAVQAANSRLAAERDTLRAELATIAATEPVNLATDQTDEFGEVIYREVFTRPMPAQDVKDAERYRWLREQHWSTDTIAVVLNPKQAVKLWYVCPSDSLLDETIDAARAKGVK